MKKTYLEVYINLDSDQYFDNWYKDFDEWYKYNT